MASAHLDVELPRPAKLVFANALSNSSEHDEVFAKLTLNAIKYDVVAVLGKDKTQSFIGLQSCTEPQRIHSLLNLGTSIPKDHPSIKNLTFHKSFKIEHAIGSEYKCMNSQQRMNSFLAYLKQHDIEHLKGSQESCKSISAKVQSTHKPITSSHQSAVRTQQKPANLTDELVSSNEKMTLTSSSGTAASTTKKPEAPSATSTVQRPAASIRATDKTTYHKAVTYPDKVLVAHTNQIPSIPEPAPTAEQKFSTPYVGRTRFEMMGTSQHNPTTRKATDRPYRSKQ
ncbi:hypothetical protein D5018_04685 [Parashewanella curva]|uniref:Uncharacterized protein n=1 Tax=Parashewanella curva TaxID=2338552 RepID=A0A3L8Q307_9GAMM|nr:hypothetical protein [Parashewanella curva]RLV60942.1 hypothetical protein D5018_04685 [Parashewanella curva]